MRIGIVLFALGSIILLRNFGFLTNAQIPLLWPGILIVVGAIMIVKPVYRCMHCSETLWVRHNACKQCTQDTKKVPHNKKIA